MEAFGFAIEDATMSIELNSGYVKVYPLFVMLLGDKPVLLTPLWIFRRTIEEQSATWPL